MRQKKFALGVYGDDNLLALAKVLWDLTSEQEIKMFFLNYGHYVIRDFHVHFKFFSEYRSGYITKKRSVLLQRYFVENNDKKNFPTVMQVRCITATVAKFAKRVTRSDLEYSLSAMSIPYDNPYNEEAYEFGLLAHTYFSAFVDPEDVSVENLQKMMRDSRSTMTQAFKKCNMTEEEICMGFPPLDVLYEKSKPNFFRWKDMTASDLDI